MTTAELMQAMADAGAPLEAIIIAVRALDEKDAALRAITEEKAQRRAADTERKRRVRGISEDNPRKIRGQSADSPRTPPYEDTSTPRIPPVKADALTAPRGSKRPKSVSVAVPDWMPAEQWRSMVAMRERMHPKVQWSEDAAKGIISKITRLRGAGHCPVKLLEKAVVSSWRTVFEADDTLAAQPSAQTPAKPELPPERQAEWDEIVAEGIRLKAEPYDHDAKQAWMDKRDRFLAEGPLLHKPNGPTRSARSAGDPAKQILSRMDVH